jgi:hypothetical protein
LGEIDMDKAAEKTSLLLIFFLLLVAPTGVQAEKGSKIDSGTFYKEVDHPTFPAPMLLEHNRRLLGGTTIGSTLSNSPNLRARGLYIEALKLHKKAIVTYRAGQEDLAKVYAYQSIRTLYRSDRLHYNLIDN